MASYVIQMKHLGDTQYVFIIQIVWNHKNRTLVMSQASYIDKMLSRYKIQNSKKVMLSYKYGIQRNNILRHLKRLKIWEIFYMLLLLGVWCTQCYALDLTFVTQ